MTVDSQTSIARGRAPGGLDLSYAAFVGAGAASPTVPTAAQALLLMPQTVNMATARQSGARVAVTITRTGVGDHTFVFENFVSPAAVWFCEPMLTGATAALDARILSLSIDATTAKLTVRVLTFIDNGTDTDLANGTDFLSLCFHGSNSKCQ